MRHETAKLILLTFMVMVFFSANVRAEPMQSANFTITTTVMSGGGTPMASTNFQMNSTIGQPSPLMEQGMDPY